MERIDQKVRGSNPFGRATYAGSRVACLLDGRRQTNSAVRSGLANGLRCLYVSAQVAAMQMGDVGLSLGDVSP